MSNKSAMQKALTRVIQGNNRGIVIAAGHVGGMGGDAQRYFVIELPDKGRITVYDEPNAGVTVAENVRPHSAVELQIRSNKHAEWCAVEGAKDAPLPYTEICFLPVGTLPIFDDIPLPFITFNGVLEESGETSSTTRTCVPMAEATTETYFKLAEAMSYADSIGRNHRLLVWNHDQTMVGFLAFTPPNGEPFSLVERARLQPVVVGIDERVVMGLGDMAFARVSRAAKDRLTLDIRIRRGKSLLWARTEGVVEASFTNENGQLVSFAEMLGDRTSTDCFLPLHEEAVHARKGMGMVKDQQALNDLKTQALGALEDSLQKANKKILKQMGYGTRTITIFRSHNCTLRADQGSDTGWVAFHELVTIAYRPCAEENSWDEVHQQGTEKERQVSSLGE